MGLPPGMGRINNASDNLVKRGIGTLETEYGIEGPSPSEDLARPALEQDVTLYNQTHSMPYRPRLILCHGGGQANLSTFSRTTQGGHRPPPADG